MVSRPNEQTPNPESRPGSPSSSSTTARKGAHTHLGLRPKKSDSLHTRIRTSHPQPKHVSKIVDVTSPTLSDPRSRLGSRSSRNASENGFGHSREGTLSRDASVAGESEREEEDGGNDDEEVMTTDIGIYDDKVYDEYLGPLLGTIRRLLIRSLAWETPLLAKHQTIVRNARLDRYFVYTSLAGSHSFFLIFLPISFWLINERFSRGLVNVLAFGVYFSSAIKDALCIPRPYSPPVTRLVIGTFHLEYGFLSTHSTNCISIVLYCYLWLNAFRTQVDPASVLQSRAWEAGLLFYLISVTYGRIYCGMHSVVDCIAGCILGSLITLAQWHWLELFEWLMENGGIKVPVVVWSVGLAMVIVHPQPLDDCPCFEDAIAFISVVIGVTMARWCSVHYNLFPVFDGRLIFKYSNVQRAVLRVKEPVVGKFASLFRKSSSMSPELELLIRWTKIATVLVVGVSLVLATRFTVKTVCRVILPPIFRFVQDTFGLILPRRHYTSSTDYAAMQKNSREAAAYSSQKAQSSAQTHKRQASWATSGHANGTYRPTSVETEGLRNRMRSHSLQSDKGNSDKNTVKFTMGDGKDVPVPFTHPNTHLPGDTFSERIAGALSHDERKRQRRESEASLHPPPQHGSMEDTFEIAHYDVDVLSKVFVYSAIGFAAAGLIPALFRYVGLLPI